VRARNAERSVGRIEHDRSIRDDRLTEDRCRSSRGNDHDVGAIVVRNEEVTRRIESKIVRARKTERSPDGSSTTGVSAVTD